MKKKTCVKKKKLKKKKSKALNLLKFPSTKKHSLLIDTNPRELKCSS